MIKTEYLRFLKTLRSDEISADVCKIANLVLGHLDTNQIVTALEQLDSALR
jgi:hypothetical protein